MSLPAPLAPADLCVRQFDKFPLNLALLEQSDFWQTQSGEVRAAALDLWTMAWRQKPAGSLPNDDKLLRRYARVEAKAWKRIRPLVMDAFVLCSDGRLYHPTVVQHALEADAVSQRNKAKRASPNHPNPPRIADTSPIHARSLPDKTRIGNPQVVEIAEYDGDCGATMKGREGILVKKNHTVVPNTQPIEEPKRMPTAAQSADLFGVPAQAEVHKFPKPNRRELEATFEKDFWPVVPLKEGKQRAKANFFRACEGYRCAKLRTTFGPEDPAKIVAGMRCYAEWVKLTGFESPKYPEGWLSDRRWETAEGLLAAAKAKAKPKVVRRVL